MKQYTLEQLEEKTVIELREISKKLGITGVSKARKDDIIDEILSSYDEKYEEPDDNNDSNEKPLYVNAGLHSVLQKDETYKTLVSVSCGASSSNYPVVGKSVGYVKGIYREILNIDVSAIGVVNGKDIKDEYILKSGDILEFIRKAGSKG